MPNPQTTKKNKVQQLSRCCYGVQNHKVIKEGFNSQTWDLETILGLFWDQQAERKSLLDQKQASL